MPAKCLLCSSNSEVSLHKFPKDKEICNLWKELCDLSSFDDVSRCFVCSKHFTPNDYLEPNAKQLGGRLVLKKKHFPTVKIPNPIQIAVPSASSKQAETVMQKAIPVPNLIIVAESSTSYEVVTSAMPTEMAVQNPTIVVEPSTSHEPAVSAMPTDAFMRTPTKRKFAEPRYVGDIKSPDFSTPKRARRTWHLAKKHIISQKKKYRLLDHKNRRLTKKVATLQDMLNRLRENNSLSEDAAETLLNVVPVGVQQLIARKLRSKKKDKYSPELRTFALSLQFYSSKAYAYVRKCWGNLLPHPSTLRAWYCKVDGKPGFSKEAFQAIKLQEEKNHVLINLVIDEMSIRQPSSFSYDGSAALVAKFSKS